MIPRGDISPPNTSRSSKSSTSAFSVSRYSSPSSVPSRGHSQVNRNNQGSPLKFHYVFLFVSLALIAYFTLDFAEESKLAGSNKSLVIIDQGASGYNNEQAIYLSGTGERKNRGEETPTEEIQAGLHEENLVENDNQKNDNNKSDKSENSKEESENSKEADHTNENDNDGIDRGFNEVNSGFDFNNIQSNLLKAFEDVQSHVNDLEAKHGPYASNLFGSFHVWNDTLLLNKLKEAVLASPQLSGLESFKDDISDPEVAGNQKKQFVIGVQGTSVTAGHDNRFNQSYPIVLGELLKGPFAAAGIEIIVRNHAMGWNPIYPSYLCVEEVIGKDADVAIWEYGMMGGQTADKETYLRTALQLPNQPAVLFLDPGEYRRDWKEGIEKRTTKPDVYKSDNRLIPDYSENFGFSIMTQSMSEATWNIDHLYQYSKGHLQAEDKVAQKKAGWHPGPHGHLLRAEIICHGFLKLLAKAIEQLSFNIREIEYLAKNNELTGEGKKRGLIHWLRHLMRTKTEIVNIQGQGFLDNFMKRAKKNLRETSKGVKSIPVRQLGGGTSISIIEEKIKALIGPTKIPLQPPKQCHKDICEVNLNPQCVTTFEPRVGPNLLEHVKRANMGGERPILETSNNDITVAEKIPKFYPGSQTNQTLFKWSHDLPPTQHYWHTQVYFCDVDAVRRTTVYEHLNYLDRKIILEGDDRSGSITLEFDSKIENHLILCSPPGNRHLQKDTKLKISNLGAGWIKDYYLLHKDDAQKKGFMVLEEPCWITNEKLPAGQYEVEIIPKKFPDTEDGKHDPFVPISHMIWW